MAWIDARDIAAVAERALLDAGHDGRVYELSGPEALTLPRTAELLSDALGRPVGPRGDHDRRTPWPACRRDSSATSSRGRSSGSTHGVFSGVTDTVERVTGRPARRLRTFLADSAPR